MQTAAGGGRIALRLYFLPLDTVEESNTHVHRLTEQMQVDVATITQILEQTVSQPLTASMFTAISAAVLLVLATGFTMWYLFRAQVHGIDRLEERLDKLQDTLTEISAKLWSEAALNNKIDMKVTCAILEHEHQKHSN